MGLPSCVQMAFLYGLNPADNRQPAKLMKCLNNNPQLGIISRSLLRICSSAALDYAMHNCLRNLSWRLSGIRCYSIWPA